MRSCLVSAGCRCWLGITPRPSSDPPPPYPGIGRRAHALAECFWSFRYFAVVKERTVTWQEEDEEEGQVEEQDPSHRFSRYSIGVGQGRFKQVRFCAALSCRPVRMHVPCCRALSEQTMHHVACTCVASLIDMIV